MHINVFFIFILKLLPVDQWPIIYETLCIYFHVLLPLWTKHTYFTNTPCMMLYGFIYIFTASASVFSIGSSFIQATRYSPRHTCWFTPYLQVHSLMLCETGFPSSEKFVQFSQKFSNSGTGKTQIRLLAAPPKRRWVLNFKFKR